ncbi:MAG: hypothetical protein MUP81_02250 [Dehalococcoidia bacterium]|nr:hypothetical protein [Dehalococcoidia bacterium]
MANLKGCRGDKAGMYADDIKTLAHRIRLGKEKLVEKNLKSAVEFYETTPELIMGDVAKILKEVYSSDERRLKFMEKDKARGKKTYYSFELGLMSIDKAIETQDKILERIEVILFG